MVTRRVADKVGVALEEELKITLGETEYLLILNQEVQAIIYLVMLSSFANLLLEFSYNPRKYSFASVGVLDQARTSHFQGITSRISRD